jgi:hypothetical protein
VCALVVGRLPYAVVDIAVSMPGSWRLRTKTGRRRGGRPPTARRLENPGRTTTAPGSHELIYDLAIDAGQTAGDSLVAGVGTRPRTTRAGGGRPRWARSFYRWTS